MLRSILIAALGVSAMTGCAAGLSPVWSMNSVVNHEQGVVVVWRYAEYEGGEPSGFDRNPVVISHAVYRAYDIPAHEIAGQSKALPVAYEYHRANPGEVSDPIFQIVGDQLHAAPCVSEIRRKSRVDAGDAKCLSEVGALSVLNQLGRRGEGAEINGNQIVIDFPDAQKPCRLDVHGLRADLGSSPFAAAIFPKARAVYVAASVDGKPTLYGSHACESLKQIDLADVAAFASGADGVQRRDVRIRDVTPTHDPSRPALLLDWTEAEEGVFRERAGVFNLASGQRCRLPADASHPLGFWNSQPMQVVLSVSGQPDAGEALGLAEVVIHDVDTKQTRTLRVEHPLR